MDDVSDRPGAAGSGAADRPGPADGSAASTDSGPSAEAGDPSTSVSPGERPLDDVTIAEIHQAASLAGSRVEHLVEDLIEAELETGRREETVEEAKRHIVWRIVRVVAGVVVTLLGIAMLALPGPGLVAIALGLGLLAQDVPFARKLLDRVRARLPQDEDGKLPKSTIVMMVVVGVGAMAISIWFTFFRG